MMVATMMMMMISKSIPVAKEGCGGVVPGILSSECTFHCLLPKAHSHTYTLYYYEEGDLIPCMD